MRHPQMSEICQPFPVFSYYRSNASLSMSRSSIHYTSPEQAVAHPSSVSHHLAHRATWASADLKASPLSVLYKGEFVAECCSRASAGDMWSGIRSPFGGYVDIRRPASRPLSHHQSSAGQRRGHSVENTKWLLPGSARSGTVSLLVYARSMQMLDN